MADRPVLILGAGINGAALARELALNGVPVVIVDTHDLGSGTSAYSSRLIHGGLRYLEYGEFDLVRESLEERNRLLTLAPDFVRPLRLFIPIENRFGGAQEQTLRFLGWQTKPAKSRGLYVVRAGLWMYDRFALGDTLPPHSIHRLSERRIPRIGPDHAHWLAAYSDAQIPFAERFVLALLQDAATAARELGVDFRLHTYSQAVRLGDEIGIRAVGDDAGPLNTTLQPAAIVNATGAWVDETLARLKQPSQTLIGGTKGSHFVTFHRGLRESLQGAGIYTEARDGRPIFILPFGDGVLVGTTDIPFRGDPASAVASEDELVYLIATANEIFPNASLTRSDIALHYSGVRPLPNVQAGSTSAITRRHLWHWHRESKVPMVSLIGGKLTTCRAFAEQTVHELLPKITRKSQSAEQNTSRERPLREAAHFGVGSLVDQARQSIRLEHAKTLEDLVERRLMLVFARDLTITTLRELAQVMCDEKVIIPSEIETIVNRCVDRLRNHFGRALAS